jgi:hypothetical protein
MIDMIPLKTNHFMHLCGPIKVYEIIIKNASSLKRKNKLLSIIIDQIKLKRIELKSEIT